MIDILTYAHNKLIIKIVLTTIVHEIGNDYCKQHH